MVGQQRNQSTLCERHSFIEELFTVTERGILPAPVSPDYGRERASAFWHDKIRRDDAAFRTIIGDVIDSRVRSLLNTDLFDSERSFLIVIKVADEIAILAEQRGRADYHKT